MLEEAEKNAALDKSKKSLVNIIYEYDSVLAKSEIVEGTIDLNQIKRKNINSLLEKVLTNLKFHYKKNNFTLISNELINDLDYLFDVMVFDLFQTILTQKKGRSSVIDVTDDAIDV